MRVPGWCASTDGPRAPNTNPQGEARSQTSSNSCLPPSRLYLDGKSQETALPSPPEGSPRRPRRSGTPSAGLPALTVLLCSPETSGEARSDLCTLGVWLEFKMS